MSSTENAAAPILVTGGAGYIGSHFIHRYLSQRPEASVVVLDDLSEGNQEAIDILIRRHPGRIRFYPCKIGDETVREVLRQHRVQAVVHFAASALVAHSQQKPVAYLKNNVEQSLRLLEMMLEADVRRFVFSSTAAVYGTPDVPLIYEDEPKKPVNVYGRTKLMVEEMLDLLQERGQLSYITLRYFNAAGADPEGLLGEGHREETHLIPIILHVAAGKREQIKVYGDDYETPDGTCVRDYIHIYDLADAHIAALDYLQAHPGTGEAFNLGTGEGNSVREVIDVCRQVTGRNIPEEMAPRREGDPPVLVASSGKARQILNWKPQHGLKEIIQTAWQWEQNRQYCK